MDRGRTWIAAVAAVAAALVPSAARALPDGSVGGNCTSCHEQRNPATPTGFSASDTMTDRVRLTWSDPSPSWTIGYDLFRSTSAVFPGGSPWVTLGPYAYPNAVSSRTYDDFTAVQGTQYYYWVRSWNAGFYSLGTASNPGRRSFPPDLACTPPSISRTAVVGNNATSATLTCENQGEGSLSYTVTDDRTWISVSPGNASGLGAGASQNHTVSFPSAALAVGSYSGQVSVNGGSAGSAAIPVSLTVQEPPDLSCTPVVSVTRLAGAISNASFSCTNNGGGSVSYTISETPSAPWLTVNPTSGTNGAGQSRNHSLVFDSLLAPGTYTATLHYDAGTAGAGDVAVTLEVQTSVVVLGVGDLLVTDRNNGRVLRVNAENGAVTTFTPRPGVTNFLVAPAGIAFESAVSFVADSATSKLVAIDAETGEQTPHSDGSGPISLGGNPWGLDVQFGFALSVSPGSHEIYRTYLIYGAPVGIVETGSTSLLGVATGLAALDTNTLVIAGRSAGLLGLENGALSLLASPSYADQVFDVDRDGAGYAWTELFAGCSSGALLSDGAGLIASGGLLRCPVSLAVTSGGGEWTAYVGDVGSLAGGSARVLAIDDTGAQSVLATLPDAANPTFPAGIAISTVEVIPEPGALARALGALLALGALSGLRRSGPAPAPSTERTGPVDPAVPKDLPASFASR